VIPAFPALGKGVVVDRWAGDSIFKIQADAGLFGGDISVAQLGRKRQRVAAIHPIDGRQAEREGFLEIRQQILAIQNNKQCALQRGSFTYRIRGRNRDRSTQRTAGRRR